MGFLLQMPQLMTISKEEIALYDRQIRLWGMDAQKKIREGSVFIVAECMSGMLQELCKNLTLSGLGSVHVHCLKDSASIGPLLYNELGANLVDINSKLRFTETFQSDPVAVFSSLPVVDYLVVIGELDRSLLLALNAAARERSIWTSWTVSRGSQCFMLNDCLNSSSSFEEVFARDAAKSHRNPLIQAFSNLEQRDYSTGNAYVLAGAAIMGALLSQEVIKFYSRKDAPIDNFLALDTLNLQNAVVRL